LHVIGEGVKSLERRHAPPAIGLRPPVHFRSGAKTMKKRLLIGFGVLLAFVTFAVLILPEYRLTVLGYLRGENFFEGRSASYWRYTVDSYAARRENPAGKTKFEKLLEYLHITSALEKPSVLGCAREVAISWRF
jgi:hypothetical protein